MNEMIEKTKQLDAVLATATRIIKDSAVIAAAIAKGDIAGVLEGTIDLVSLALGIKPPKSNEEKMMDKLKDIDEKLGKIDQKMDEVQEAMGNMDRQNKLH